MAKDRKSRRMGFGEFEEPSLWRAREVLQRQVLDEVRREVPGVLKELASDVLPLYEAVTPNWARSPEEDLGPALEGLYGPNWKDTSSFGYLSGLIVNSPEVKSWHEIETSASKGDPEFSQLHQAVGEWALRWFKDAPYWLMLTATETLTHWRSGNEGVGARDWYFGDDLDVVKFHSPILREPDPFQFEYEGWPFWRQTKADWIEDVNRAYDAARKDYVHYLIDIAEKLGLISTEEVRPRSDWQIPAFVRFQVKGETKAAIYDSLELQVTPRQVDRAIQQIASDARIALRHEPAGRKAGSKDQNRGEKRRPGSATRK